MKTIFLCIQNKFHTGTVFRVALIDSRSSCTCVFVTPSVWTCAHCFSILDPGIIEISPRDKKKEQTNETSATNTVFKDFSKMFISVLIVSLNLISMTTACQVIYG